MAFNKIISIFKKPNEAPKADSPSDIFSEGSDFFAPFKTVFDVGAHHGKVTKQLKWLSPDAVIHAFEPFTKSYERLPHHFAEDPKVLFNNLAASITDREPSSHSH